MMLTLEDAGKGWDIEDRGCEGGEGFTGSEVATAGAVS